MSPENPCNLPTRRKLKRAVYTFSYKLNLESMNLDKLQITETRKTQRYKDQNSVFPCPCDYTIIATKDSVLILDLPSELIPAEDATPIYGPAVQK